MNHGLLLASPLPPQLGVCEPQKWHNPIGFGLSSDLNRGVGGALVAMDHSCCQLIGQKLRVGHLGVSRSQVFKIKNFCMMART